MRATIHHARKGAHGVFSAKHNDRNFDFESDPHIDAERTSQNRVWKCSKSAESIDEAEKKFYEKHFSKYLEKQNAKHLKSRHKERVKDIDAFRRTYRYAPEETIWQIGSVADGSVDPELLHELVKEQLAWERETFPQAKVLDFALHMDEATPHIQSRKVWIAHDPEGLEMPYQNKALEEMGIQRPDPTKPVSAENCAKQTYTRICREHFQELCKEHGLELETEPRDPSESGKPLRVWKAEQDEKKALKRLSRAKKELKEVREDSELVRSIEKSSRKAQIPEIKAKALGSGVVVQSDPETVRNAFVALQRQQDMVSAEKKARKKAKDLKIQATKEARSEVKSLEKRAEDLEKTLSSAEERVAQRQLNEIKEDFPQIFNSLGVYQRGHSVAERKAMQVLKDEWSK